MSTKSTILLTKDNEHWYEDHSEILSTNPYKTAITLEFDKRNIRIDHENDESFMLTVTNPDCEIYQVLANLNNVCYCGLTSEEVKERAMLLRLQSDHTRWFTKQEFDRLKELSNKMFKNVGSPHFG